MQILKDASEEVPEQGFLSWNLWVYGLQESWRPLKLRENFACMLSILGSREMVIRLSKKFGRVKG